MFIQDCCEREVWKCKLEDFDTDDNVAGVAGYRPCLIIINCNKTATVLPFTTKVEKYKISDDLVVCLTANIQSVPRFDSIKTIAKSSFIRDKDAFMGVMNINKYNLIIQTIHDISSGKIILPEILHHFRHSFSKDIQFNVGVPETEPVPKVLNVDSSIISNTHISYDDVVDDKKNYYCDRAVELRNNRINRTYLVIIHTAFCQLISSGNHIIDNIDEYMGMKYSNIKKAKICGFFDKKSKTIYIEKDLFLEAYSTLGKRIIEDISSISTIEILEDFVEKDISKTRFKVGLKAATKTFKKEYGNITPFIPFDISNIKLDIRGCHVGRRFINDLFLSSIPETLAEEND